jgi:hypothetical protein
MSPRAFFLILLGVAVPVIAVGCTVQSDSPNAGPITVVMSPAVDASVDDASPDVPTGAASKPNIGSPLCNAARTGRRCGRRIGRLRQRSACVPGTASPWRCRGPAGMHSEWLGHRRRLLRRSERLRARLRVRRQRRLSALLLRGRLREPKRVLRHSADGKRPGDEGARVHADPQLQPAQPIEHARSLPHGRDMRCRARQRRHELRCRGKASGGRRMRYRTLRAQPRVPRHGGRSALLHPLPHGTGGQRLRVDAQADVQRGLAFVPGPRNRDLRITAYRKGRRARAG